MQQQSVLYVLPGTKKRPDVYRQWIEKFIKPLALNLEIRTLANEKPLDSNGIVIGIRFPDKKEKTKGSKDSPVITLFEQKQATILEISFGVNKDIANCFRLYAAALVLLGHIDKNEKLVEFAGKITDTIGKYSSESELPITLDKMSKKVKVKAKRQAAKGENFTDPELGATQPFFMFMITELVKNLS